MSRPDNKKIEGLRDIFDFREKYDVFLACGFEPEEINYSSRDLGAVFNFYDRVGVRLLRKLEKELIFLIRKLI